MYRVLFFKAINVFYANRCMLSDVLCFWCFSKASLPRKKKFPVNVLAENAIFRKKKFPVKYLPFIVNWDRGSKLAFTVHQPNAGSLFGSFISFVSF